MLNLDIKLYIVAFRQLKFCLTSVQKPHTALLCLPLVNKNNIQQTVRNVQAEINIAHFQCSKLLKHVNNNNNLNMINNGLILNKHEMLTKSQTLHPEKGSTQLILCLRRAFSGRRIFFFSSLLKHAASFLSELLN